LTTYEVSLHFKLRVFTSRITRSERDDELYLNSKR